MRLVSLKSLARLRVLEVGEVLRLVSFAKTARLTS